MPPRRNPRNLFPAVVALLATLAAVSSRGETHDRFRPALVGHGPKSIVNLIDGQKLVRAGQGDGVVMFDATIEDDADGTVDWIWCHPSPSSPALKAEVEKELTHASFIPAMIDDKRVTVIFHGTVIFAVREGHPYLRVFSNQDPQAVTQSADYIQPQMLAGSEDWDDKLEDMLGVVKHHARMGHAIVSLTVDAEGKVLDRHLVREDPRGLNLGAAAMRLYSTAKFIPGFRDGRPVACTFREDWSVRGYVFHRW